MNEKISKIQKQLKENQLDGWLFYDFRGSNDLAMQLLEIPKHIFFSRRFFYWVPTEGSPIAIVHTIESGNLDTLPGEKQIFLKWQELEEKVAAALQGKKKIAMEYSPRNAIPYVSKVDAGTMEMVRGCGVEVVSSADMLQHFTSVWDEEKKKSHFEAAEFLDKTAARTWEYIRNRLEFDEYVSEYEVQQFIIGEMRRHHFTHEGDPMVQVNAHSADPHYIPNRKQDEEIKKGDFILIDLWCKRDHQPNATYGDITRVGVVAEKPTERQNEIFSVVRKAQEAAINLVKERFAKEEPLMGWEVDESARKIIRDAGYEQYFVHRTGHNIDTSDHGNGAHIDSLETNDQRQILKGTCFSIEPGIYIPGEFGIRQECNLFIDHDGTVHVTGGQQEEVEAILGKKSEKTALERTN